MSPQAGRLPVFGVTRWIANALRTRLHTGSGPLTGTHCPEVTALVPMAPMMYPRLSTRLNVRVSGPTPGACLVCLTSPTVSQLPSTGRSSWRYPGIGGCVPVCSQDDGSNRSCVQSLLARHGLIFLAASLLVSVSTGYWVHLSTRLLVVALALPSPAGSLAWAGHIFGRFLVLAPSSEITDGLQRR